MNLECNFKCEILPKLSNQERVAARITFSDVSTTKKNERTFRELKKF